MTWLRLPSPSMPLDPWHSIEMAVSAYERKSVLPAERRNPQVISWNRLAKLSQFKIDGRVVMGSFLDDIQDPAVRKEAVQPPLIARPMAGLRNPKAILPNDNNGQSELRGASQNSNNAGMLLRCRGKRIRVQDQSRLTGVHISGSTFSNASSITLLIRRVSLRKSFNLPMCFIQGLWPSAGATFSLSSTASVTNCLRGMPCSAAFDFARRKIVSGISKVVFMDTISHIYGRRVNIQRGLCNDVKERQNWRRGFEGAKYQESFRPRSF